MRWFVLVLLLPTAAALLDDAEGDVAIDHCETAQSPSVGFEAMDLRSLQMHQTPSQVRFDIATTGLEREADYDAGNYFVQFWRGDLHYTLRLYQANAGTGATMEVVVARERSIFGPTFLEFPASVQGTHIVADMPKNQLRDHAGKYPVTGDVLRDLVVSAQAHATGVYACPDATGPLIVHDEMPDDGVGVDYVMDYGGVVADGPIEFQVLPAFRASNGEATTYAFTQTVRNVADGPRTFSFDASVPEGWTAHVALPVTVDAGETAQAVTYLQVPFVHVHGVTKTATLSASSEDARADAEVGVHYLDVAQPSGHHPKVHLHSLAALGAVTELSAALGDGDHFLYWNTVEEDPSDHRLPLSARTVDGAMVWQGCLAPALGLGLHPDTGRTGSFTFELDAQVPVAGTLTGHIGILPDGDRPELCHEADGWERDVILELEPVQASLDGPTLVQGNVRAVDGTPRPHAPGSDLLLELRFTPDQPVPVGGTVDLLPGATMDLPLLDHHEPAPDLPDEVVARDRAQPVEDEESPLSVAVALLGLLIARRALK